MSMASTRRDLHVRVVQADRLPKLRPFGRPNPFCNIYLKSHQQKQQTGMVESTFAPVWSEEFSFIVQKPNDALIIEIQDQERTGQSVQMASIEIPLSSLKTNVIEEKWFKLNPMQENMRGGRLKLCLHFTNPGVIPFQLLPIPAGTQPPYVRQLPPITQSFPPHTVYTPYSIPFLPRQDVRQPPPMFHPHMNQIPMMPPYQQPQWGYPPQQPPPPPPAPQPPMHPFQQRY